MSENTCTRVRFVCITFDAWNPLAHDSPHFLLCNAYKMHGEHSSPRCVRAIISKLETGFEQLGMYVAFISMHALL